MSLPIIDYDIDLVTFINIMNRAGYIGKCCVVGYCDNNQIEQGLTRSLTSGGILLRLHSHSHRRGQEIHCHYDTGMTTTSMRTSDKISFFNLTRHRRESSQSQARLDL